MISKLKNLLPLFEIFGLFVWFAIIGLTIFGIIVFGIISGFEQMDEHGWSGDLSDVFGLTVMSFFGIMITSMRVLAHVAPIFIVICAFYTLFANAGKNGDIVASLGGFFFFIVLDYLLVKYIFSMFYPESYTDYLYWALELLP